MCAYEENLCKVIGPIGGTCHCHGLRDIIRVVLSLIARAEVLRFIPETHPRKIPRYTSPLLLWMKLMSQMRRTAVTNNTRDRKGYSRNITVTECVWSSIIIMISWSLSRGLYLRYFIDRINPYSRIITRLHCAIASASITELYHEIPIVISVLIKPTWGATARNSTE